MEKLNKLKIKIFSDGANREEMIKMASDKKIMGLTTNPTLMKKAGIINYEEFCRDLLGIIKNKPISFEVFSDDIREMKEQAKKISSWGENVYVKIPITNTKKISTLDLIADLCESNIKVNVTAIMTLEQVRGVLSVLRPTVPSYISVFAGRIADTGIDPLPVMIKALQLMEFNSSAELIWASPRELLNIFQANDIGCHIITVTKDILDKLKYVDYPLDEYSLDTVKMFYKDAIEAGYDLG
jgi:transaldolase